MTEAESLLETLRQHGAKVWHDGKQLRLKTPKGVLNKAQIAAIKKNKNAISLLVIDQEAMQNQDSSIESRSLPEPPLKTGPLSFGQQALWTLYKLVPNNPAFNLLFACRLPDDVNLNALFLACDQLVKRHDLLRSEFFEQQGIPVQTVRDGSRSRMALEKCTTHYLEPQQIDQFIARRGDKPFDLSKGAIRALLVSNTTDSSTALYFALNLHHIIADFFTYQVVLGELSVLYQSIVDRKNTQLPATLVNFQDFVRWQQTLIAHTDHNVDANSAQQIHANHDHHINHINHNNHNNHWRYWQSLLSGTLPVLDLPLDRPRPMYMSLNGKRINHFISKALAGKIKARAKWLNITPSATVMAAYFAFLARYTGQQDIIVGIPTANRPLPGSEWSVGDYSNAIAIRPKIELQKDFQTLATAVHQGLLEGMRHQDYPFSQLIERLNPARSTRYPPIFQTNFVWRQPQEELIQSVIGMHQSVLANVLTISGQRGAIYDLTLSVLDASSGMWFDWNYNSDILTTDSVTRIAERFELFLENIIDQPSVPISSIAFQFGNAQRQVAQSSLTRADDCNDDNSHYDNCNNDHNNNYNDNNCDNDIDNNYIDTNTDFVAVIESNLQSQPHQLAWVEEAQHYSHQQIYQAIQRLTQWLSQHLSNQDQVIGIVTEHPLLATLCTISLAKLKYCFVQLPPPDDSSQALTAALKNLTLSKLLIESSQADTQTTRSLPALTLPTLKQLLSEKALDYKTPATKSTPVRPNPARQPRLNACIDVSSGHPKPITYAKFNRRIAQFSRQLPGNTCAQGAVLNATSSHLFTLETLGAWHRGHTLHLIANDENRWQRLHQKIAAQQINWGLLSHADLVAFLEPYRQSFSQLPNAITLFCQTLDPQQQLKEIYGRVFRATPEQAGSRLVLQHYLPKLGREIAYQAVDFNSSQENIDPASLCQQLVNGSLYLNDEQDQSVAEGLWGSLTFQSESNTPYRTGLQGRIQANRKLHIKTDADAIVIQGMPFYLSDLKALLPPHPWVQDAVATASPNGWVAYLALTPAFFESQADDYHVFKQSLLNQMPASLRPEALLLVTSIPWQKFNPSQINVQRLTAITPCVLAKAQRRVKMIPGVTAVQCNTVPLTAPLYSTAWPSAELTDARPAHSIEQLRVQVSVGVSVNVNGNGNENAASEFIKQQIERLKIVDFNNQPVPVCVHIEALNHTTPTGASKTHAPLAGVVLDKNGFAPHHFNHTQHDFDFSHTIVQRFDRQAQRSPQAIAVEFADRSLSYQDLAIQSNQLAHLLTQHKVGAGDHVALLMERCSGHFVALLAILRVGAAYVPIDPHYPSARVRYLLEDATPKKTITQRALQERFNLKDSQTLCLDQLDFEQFEPEPLINLVSKDSLAYIIYTSGSTGQPKGVKIHHHAFLNVLLHTTEELQIKPRQRWLAVASFSFDAAGLDCFVPLINGATIVLTNHAQQRDGHLLAQCLTQNIDYMQATPSTWQLLLNSHWPGNSKLTALSGGETLHSPLAKKLSPKVQRLFNFYGPTETTVNTATYQVKEISSDSVPIGKPIANNQLFVLDPQLQPSLFGDVGELYVAGAGVGQGYLDRQPLSAEHFIELYLDGAQRRVYKTGDLVRFNPAGDLEFKGRLDDQIKVRGFRIELGEIEATLQFHPDVENSVAQIITTNQTAGPLLVVYILPKQADKPLPDKITAQELKSWLSQQLPHHMIPSQVLLLTEFPLTPSGKVDRNALSTISSQEKQINSQHATTTSNSMPFTVTSVPSQEAPRTETEKQLLQIWQIIFTTSPFGIHDDFFELGGHSLSATWVTAQVSAQMNIQIPVAAFFEYPTVASLAQKIDQQAFRKQLPESFNTLNRNHRLPLSGAQKRLFFLQQLEGPSPTFNVPFGVYLDGNLNLSALQSALNSMVQRHETLRSHVQMKDGDAEICILPEMPIFIDVADLSLNAQDTTDLVENLSDNADRNSGQGNRKKTPQCSEQKIQEIFSAEASTPFDVTRAPLFRVQLYKLSDHRHALITNTHHIITDGWSSAIFAKEFMSLYASHINQQDTTLTPLPLQYVDFAHWQEKWLQSEIVSTQINYWQEKLQGLPPLLDLPTDHPRPRLMQFKGAQQSFLIPKQTLAQLHELCQFHGVTLYMLLLAVLSILLQRHSRQQDIAIGSPIANRSHKEFENIIGMFINTLVMRNHVDQELRFNEFLLTVKETALQAYANQDASFEQVVDALQPPRSLSHTPLFQVMLVLQNIPHQSFNLPELNLRPMDLQHPVAKYDLNFQLMEINDELLGSVQYNTDLFDRKTIQTLIEHFRHLLSSVVFDSQQKVGDLSMSSNSEKPSGQAQNLDTFQDYDFSCNIIHRFDRQAEASPEAIAIEFEGQQLRYVDLALESNQLAALLCKRGIEANDLVAVVMDRTPKMLIALLAIMRSGAAYVPIDPEYPVDRVRYMLEHAAPKIIVTTTSHQQYFSMHGEHLILLDSPEIMDIVEAGAINNVADTINLAKADHLAYVIYTSGSTGRPKGVKTLHRGLQNLLLDFNDRLEMQVQQRWLAVASISFDAAGLDIFLPLITGGTIVLANYQQSKDGQWLNCQLDQQIDYLHATPSTWQLLLNSGWTGTPQLTAISGGEMLTGKLATQIAERLKCLYNVYGPTEASIITACHAVSDTHQHSISIGQAIANTQLHILDATLRPVPTGVAGELHIAGLGLGQGYLHQPELTAQRYIALELDDGTHQTIYKTGDLVRLRSDGNLEFLSRLDHQVKVRGFRVELEEIEAALLEHPSIESAVASVKTNAQDSTDTVLLAHIVFKPQQQHAPHLIKQWLSKSLPPFMVPHVITTLDAMPLSPNGKINRAALPEPHALGTILKRDIVAPRDHLELSLVQLWQPLLKVHPIGITEDFFELGGHSLLAMKLLVQLEEKFQRKIAMSALFQATTIEQFADQLRNDHIHKDSRSNNHLQGNGNPMICLRPGDDSIAPLFLIHPVGGTVFCYYQLANALGNNRPIYGLQLPVDNSGAPLACSIKAMAAIYVDCIIRQAGETHALIAGWSMGGVIAFEMARILQMKNLTPQQILMFDSAVPNHHRFNRDTQQLMALTNLALELGIQTSPLDISMLSQSDLNSQLEVKLASLLTQSKKLGLVPHAFSSADLRQRYDSIYSNQVAHHEYTVDINAYEGAISLISAQRQSDNSLSSATSDWQQYAPKINIESGDGDHHSMLKKPYVHTLAKTIDILLKKATHPSARHLKESTTNVST